MCRIDLPSGADNNSLSTLVPCCLFLIRAICIPCRRWFHNVYQVFLVRAAAGFVVSSIVTGLPLAKNAPPKAIKPVDFLFARDPVLNSTTTLWIDVTPCIECRPQKYLSRVKNLLHPVLRPLCVFSDCATTPFPPRHPYIGIRQCFFFSGCLVTFARPLGFIGYVRFSTSYIDLSIAWL